MHFNCMEVANQMDAFQLHGSSQSDLIISTIVTVGEIKQDNVDKVRQLRMTLTKMWTIFHHHHHHH